MLYVRRWRPFRVPRLIPISIPTFRNEHGTRSLYGLCSENSAQWARTGLRWINKDSWITLDQRRNTITTQTPRPLQHECSSCHLRFKSTQSLVYHKTHSCKNSVAPSRPFECTSCGKTFITERDLGKHRNYTCAVLSRKLGENFKCEECGTTHPTRQVYLCHMRDHRRPRADLNCPECKLQLRTEAGLERHMKSHSPEWKLRCSCGARFASTTTLRRHQMNCSDSPLVSEFSCPQCEKPHRSEIALRDHLLLAHSGYTIRCKVCTFHTSKIESLYLHMTSIHGLKVSDWRSHLHLHPRDS